MGREMRMNAAAEQLEAVLQQSGVHVAEKLRLRAGVAGIQPAIRVQRQIQRILRPREQCCKRFSGRGLSGGIGRRAARSSAENGLPFT